MAHAERRIWRSVRARLCARQAAGRRRDRARPGVRELSGPAGAVSDL